MPDVQDDQIPLIERIRNQIRKATDNRDADTRLVRERSRSRKLRNPAHHLLDRVDDPFGRILIALSDVGKNVGDFGNRGSRIANFLWRGRRKTAATSSPLAKSPRRISSRPLRTAGRSSSLNRYTPKCLASMSRMVCINSACASPGQVSVRSNNVSSVLFAMVLASIPHHGNRFSIPRESRSRRDCGRRCRARSAAGHRHRPCG